MCFFPTTKGRQGGREEKGRVERKKKGGREKNATKQRD